MELNCIAPNVLKLVGAKCVRQNKWAIVNTVILFLFSLLVCLLFYQKDLTVGSEFLHTKTLTQKRIGV